jgi:hypothetical protein
MTSPQPAEPAASDSRPLSRAVIIAVLAASLMVGSFAISTQSYWTNEAFSLIVAKAPDPSQAWKYAQAVSGSTLHMPLYHAYLFAWHKIIGGHEWAMRASNLPWFLLGQLAFLLLLRERQSLALTACLLAAVSPFLWMYLDETRPYVLQFAAASWLTVGLMRLTADNSAPSRLWLPLLLAGLLLFGSSLLGAIWATAFLAAFAWLRMSKPSPLPASDVHRDPATPAFSRVPLYLLLPFALAALALVAYYTWTWSSAASGYHRSGVSLLSLPYVAYELLGFTGFGPGKLDLRNAPLRSLFSHLPALLPLALTIGALVTFGLLTVRDRPPTRRTVIAWLLALALPGLALLAALFLVQYQPQPRHFMPALPALLLAAAVLLRHSFAQKFLLWRAAAVLLPLLWLASSLNLRWNGAHAKDDYRTAAALAAAALHEGKEVWWAADPAAAFIYMTPVALEEVPGRVWAMQGPGWDDVRFKYPPRIIVISKPDIYDSRNAISRYAAENQFSPALQLQAFTIFTRHPEDLPQQPNPRTP